MPSTSRIDADDDPAAAPGVVDEVNPGCLLRGLAQVEGRDAAQVIERGLLGRGRSRPWGRGAQVAGGPEEGGHAALLVGRGHDRGGRRDPGAGGRRAEAAGDASR